MKTGQQNNKKYNQNYPNIDLCNNKSKTHEAITFCSIRVQQIQNTYNVKIYTKFQNRSTRHKSNRK